MIQETDTDQLRADLEESIELTWAEEDVANTVEKRLTKCLEQSGCESALPANQRVSFPISAYLSECELDPNVDFAGAEQSVIGRICSASKLLLGGGGRGPYSINIQCPPDQRLISANMVLMRVVDDCGSTVRIEASLEDITWRIIDTIDFCPGNLGDGVETDLATRPLCRLEAAGFAFDIGIDLTLNRPNRAFTFKIPTSCTQSCRTQPPGSECAEVCGPNGLAGQCSENGSNDGGKECGGEETVVDVVASFDPNLKTGPQGFGPENWTSAVSPLPYRIDFENLADASAPAGRVVVTDELDPRLNALSVRLGDMVLSGTTVDVPDNAISFQTEVDLIAERGVIVEVTAGVDTTVVPARVFWIFQSIDPATGEAPLDPFLGFLPPEDGSGRGQGFVTFTVRPKSATTDGAVIENEAEIVFDANAPILTNMVSNTLDRALPSSSVLPLPSVTTDTTLLVSVVGSDTGGGSGLEEFRLFMSTDGGPFQAIGASVSGEFVSPVLAAGHVYGFASQAVDRAGGVEPLPSEPDTIVAVPSITLAAASDTGVVGDGVTNDATPTMLIVSAPLSSVAVSVVGRGTPVEVTTDDLGRATATVGGSGLNDGTYTVVATSNGVSVSTAVVVDTVVTGELAWRIATVHGDVGPSIAVLPEGAPFVESRLGGITEIVIETIGKSPCAVSAPTLRIDGTALDGNAIANPPAVLVEPTATGWLARCTTPIATPGVYCLTLSGAIDCAGNLRPITQRRRTLVMLPGDATGDRRVNNTDVGGVASLLGTDPIDVRNALHTRSDIDRDGDVDAADLQIVLAERGKDARFIAAPCPPEPAQNGVVVSSEAGTAQGATNGDILSTTSRPTEGGVAAADAGGDASLEASDESSDPASPWMLVAIEALPGLDAALLADTERFHSVAPWGDDTDGRMWWLAEVSVETVEQLTSGALDTMVAFSSPVRTIDASTFAFDGRDVLVAMDERSQEESLRKIRAALPVIEHDEVLGARDGRVFVRLSTRLPDGFAVRALAESIVDRGLALEASPEVHFVTTSAAEFVEQAITALPELAATASRVAILGTSDEVEEDARVIVLPAYIARSEGGEVRVFGRSSSQVEALLKAMSLEVSVVFDLAREAPRMGVVELLWKALKEAPARELQLETDAQNSSQ
ncbi:MAG: Ig-like domain-containing protein [Limnohabitans sp.]|nr:Ig-like domain-containing protein [Limnohabitans sp.]